MLTNNIVTNKNNGNIWEIFTTRKTKPHWDKDFITIKVLDLSKSESVNQRLMDLVFLLVH